MRLASRCAHLSARCVLCVHPLPCLQMTRFRPRDFDREISTAGTPISTAGWWDHLIGHKTSATGSMIGFERRSHRESIRQPLIFLLRHLAYHAEGRTHTSKTQTDTHTHTRKKARALPNESERAGVTTKADEGVGTFISRLLVSLGLGSIKQAGAGALSKKYATGTNLLVRGKRNHTNMRLISETGGLVCKYYTPERINTPKRPDKT